MHAGVYLWAEDLANALSLNTAMMQAASIAGPAIGGMLIASTVGLILQYTGSYLPIFVIAGSTYLVALGIIHLLAPRLEPADVEDAIA